MNYYFKYILVLLIYFTIPVSARKVKIDSFKSIENSVRNQSWFKIIPLEKILIENQSIIYKKCFGEVAFEFKPFTLSSKFPHKGYFKECFILEIPQGRAQGKEGFVFINDQLPEEMVWANRYEFLRNIPKIETDKIIKINGRVAVVTQVAYDNYCHFFYEVLARLAMLEMHGIEYDWLYIPFDKKFIKEGLRLWGIDETKIICPIDKDFCIQADNLIIPSLVLNTNNGFRHAGVNAHSYTLKYVREKLLDNITDKVDISKFSKKIFISRRDAPSRRILNEDEIFEYLKLKGFERYDTGKMSIEEQIALFAQAEVIIGEHGAGLTNILFCKERTKIIELFQALIDTSFWFSAQIFNLQYIPVNTLSLNADYFANWISNNPHFYFKAQNSKLIIPLDNLTFSITNLL